MAPFDIGGRDENIFSINSELIAFMKTRKKCSEELGGGNENKWGFPASAEVNISAIRGQQGSICTAKRFVIKKLAYILKLLMPRREQREASGNNASI